jgi:hypothetical protein
MERVIATGCLVTFHGGEQNLNGWPHDTLTACFVLRMFVCVGALLQALV